MKRLISTAALMVFLISSLSLNAATNPKDVYGWDNVKWGMTGEEVQDALGKEAKKREAKHDKKEGMYAGLELKGIKMGSGSFRASFWMDEDSKKLKRIVFVPEGQPAQFEWAETFITLENYLVEKYGDPDIEETSNDPGTSAERVWNFPSTEIEMSYLRLEGAELLLLVFSHRDVQVK
ncbi:MAG: hypothetical protein IH964_03575 [Candidatus Dadabacteria bacterium]|nr:hypothetical protein [Candidatus Dadabacteria bacterium]